MRERAATPTATPERTALLPQRETGPVRVQGRTPPGAHTSEDGVLTSQVGRPRASRSALPPTDQPGPTAFTIAFRTSTPESRTARRPHHGRGEQAH
jgi:hypothetical protein